MKAIDIALKDLTRSFRSAFAVVFMFGVPLLVTGMFYLMFGNMAGSGGFDLPRTKVIIANMDAGGPKFQVNPKNIPGGREAKTMGDLIVNILQSDDMTDLIEVSFASDAQAARTSVDNQDAQVAIIIPSDFSEQFADVEEGKAVIEFYQDPTLTIGPAIMRSILNRFLDSMAGVKIAVNVFMDEADPSQYALAGQVVQGYLDTSLALSEDLEGDLLDVQSPSSTQQSAEEKKPEYPAQHHRSHHGWDDDLLCLLHRDVHGAKHPQGGRGTHPAAPVHHTHAPSDHPDRQAAFRIHDRVRTGDRAADCGAPDLWHPMGRSIQVALVALGIIFSASSFGIFVNSFLKNTKQAGVLFGGVLTVTGMLGMISIFAMGSPGAAVLSGTVSLLVPQGWAIRGLLQSMNGEPVSTVLLSFLAMLGWSIAFFIVGVLRFNRRYL